MKKTSYASPSLTGVNKNCSQIIRITRDISIKSTSLHTNIKLDEIFTYFSKSRVGEIGCEIIGFPDQKQLRIQYEY